MVNAPNLTTYFRGKKPLTHQYDQDVAQTYGEVARDDCEPYDDIAQVYNSTNATQYFCRRKPKDKIEFAYRFNEYNIHDKRKLYGSLTNRVITASSGKCYKYDARQKPGKTEDLYGDLAAYEYTLSNDSFKSQFSISIPLSSDGWTATTYIYRGSKVPPSKANRDACGDRCIWLWAHRTAKPKDGLNSTFFQCPITISKVSNANTSPHQLPDSVARVAAASIALQGRWSGLPNNKIWTQYQFYPVK